MYWRPCWIVCVRISRMLCNQCKVMSCEKRTNHRNIHECILHTVGKCSQKRNSSHRHTHVTAYLQKTIKLHPHRWTVTSVITSGDNPTYCMAIKPRCCFCFVHTHTFTHRAQTPLHACFRFFSFVITPSLSPTSTLGDKCEMYSCDKHSLPSSTSPNCCIIRIHAHRASEHTPTARLVCSNKQVLCVFATRLSNYVFSCLSLSLLGQLL